MSYLLDTNLVSELRKQSRADAGVREWYASVDASTLHLSVLVVGELRRGVERLRRRDALAASRLDRWVEGLLVLYASRILPVDQRVGETWGRFASPDPLPDVDALLAATAIVHDLIFVTRDVRDVASTGVRTLNPFRK
jgi:predicted nucleic acid-binding protein